MLSQQTNAPIVPTAEATLITPGAHEMLEVKATSLLFFGMVCARPCPSSWGAWLAIVSGIAILCSSNQKLLCRSRFSRLLAVFTAIFAGYTLLTLIQKSYAGMPLQLAAKVHDQCDLMPKDTFAWAKDAVVEHKHLNRGLSFLDRHMHDQTTSPTFYLISPETNQNASLPALITGAVEPKNWSQPEACDKIARFVACFAKMAYIGNAFAHLFLLLSAIAVVKRVFRLRCAAFRAGMIKWKCCKAACKRNESVQAAVTPASTAAKEMA